MTLKDYGFRSNDSNIAKAFENITIYPEWINRKKLAKKTGITGCELCNIISQFPVNAPIIEEGDSFSRLK